MGTVCHKLPKKDRVHQIHFKAQPTRDSINVKSAPQQNFHSPRSDLIRSDFQKSDQLKPAEQSKLISVQNSFHQQSDNPDPEEAMPCSEPGKPIILGSLPEIVTEYEIFKQYMDCAGLPPHKFTSNGNIYVGQWKNKMRHGRGRQYQPDGTYYDGYWNNHVQNGFGLLINPDQSHYRGNWVDGFQCGRGVFTDANSVYEGEFFDDEKSGKGIQKYNNGDRYEGEFKANKKHGQGKYFFADGNIYEGQYRNDQIHGQGYYQWADGSYYKGEWHHNMMHGKGEFKWTNGNIYIGEYKEGKKEGFGIVKFADGKEFQGQWLNGKQQGKGVVISPEGVRQEGVWEAGKLMK